MGDGLARPGGGGPRRAGGACGALDFVAIFRIGSSRYSTRCIGSLIVMMRGAGSTTTGPIGGSVCSRRVRPLPSRAIVLVERRSIRLPSGRSCAISVIALALNGAPSTGSPNSIGSTPMMSMPAPPGPGPRIPGPGPRPGSCGGPP